MELCEVWGAEAVRTENWFELNFGKDQLMLNTVIIAIQRTRNQPD